VTKRIREFRPLAPTANFSARQSLALAAGVVSGLAGLLALPAAAESNPYYIGVSESISHDNNLLRLADGQPANTGYTRADTTMSTALQAGIDQSFGRQRASANLSLRDVRYSANSQFNNQGYTGSLGLDWSTAERVSGSLSANANRSLSSFNNYQVGFLADKNYEDTQGLNAQVNVGLVTQYSLEFSAGQRAVSNTLDNPIVQARNFKQDTGGLALRWRPSGISSFSLGFHDTRGRYPKYSFIGGEYQADRFKQTTVDVSASLVPSGASTVDFRIGQSQTRYDLNSARNFSGLTGTLGWNWQASGRFKLGTRLSRDTGQDSYATTVFGNVPGSSDYSRLVNTLRVDGSYDYSAKIAFTASWQLAQRTIVQTIVNPLLPLNASGKDSTNSYTVGVRWAPLRTVSLGCDATQEQRSASGELTTSLHSTGLSCFGQLQFQP
jgi:hypothetical protein